MSGLMVTFIPFKKFGLLPVPNVGSRVGAGNAGAASKFRLDDDAEPSPPPHSSYSELVATSSFRLLL
jgi:hypothetical protein